MLKIQNQQNDFHSKLSLALSSILPTPGVSEKIFSKVNQFPFTHLTERYFWKTLYWSFSI